MKVTVKFPNTTTVWSAAWLFALYSAALQIWINFFVS